MAHERRACEVDGCETPTRGLLCARHRHARDRFNRPCDAPNCTNLGQGRYCSKHYYRLRTHGLLEPPPRHPSAVERFNAQHDHGPSCWLWTGATDRDGYGVIRVNGRQRRAHRYSWELHCDPITDGLQVLHTCDRPSCVNPAHLRLGTGADNAADSARKLRRLRGARSPSSKLTEGQVLNLRDEYAAGGVTQAELARRYGISAAMVSFIVTRKAWRHI